jgi:deoxycytidylate deaminase
MSVPSRFKRFIELAKSLPSYNRSHDIRVHHVTFMCRKSKIIAIGINHPKTNVKNLKYDYINRNNESIAHSCGTHSELSAIIQYGKEDCNDITFINVRIDRNGKANNSKPCRGCSSLLKQVGFKKLYYTDSTGSFIEWTT